MTAMLRGGLSPRLNAMVDQRLAAINEMGACQVPGVEVIITHLVEAPEGTDLARWDRTCDLCGVYVRPGLDFHCGIVGDDTNNKRVVIGFGVCETCRAAEDVTSS